jgi:arylformamidase
MGRLSIIDITRPLVEGIEVYPGDEPFARGLTCRVADGATSNVSWVRGTSHAGTHVDLPAHLFEGSSEPPTDVFIGECLVCERPIQNFARRMLVKGRGPLAASDTESMLGAECVLVGVEGMSVDAVGNDDLPNHKRLLGAGIAILENLDLSGVAVGLYELIAMPLNIPGADATWVRAVLRTL